MGNISRRVMAAVILMTALCAGRVVMADYTPHTVNLLPLIDVDKDAIGGTWKLDHGAVVSDDTRPARLRIPYEPPEEYDFHIEFVRMSGGDDVGQIFRYSGHSCLWVMAAGGNSICGFSFINGLGPGEKNNPSRFEGHAIFQEGHKYSSLVQVRKGSVVASINGKIVSKCSLDPSKYSISDGYSVGTDGLDLGSWGSPTVFGVVEVVEISGPGKLSPKDKSNQQVTEKKPDEPADTGLHADTVQDDKPISGAVTRVAKALASIKALEAYTTESGKMLGQTSEMTLTVTRGDASKAMSVRYTVPVSDQMIMARDEVQRFIRLTYPNWYADTAELTFEDKNTGSNGAAVGTLILSAIQGFDIDSDAAISGDISANGKVRAISGISARIHGATASKCDVVAVPMENYDQLVDGMIYNGPALLSDIQVIGIANLDDAVAVMRTDRDAGLAKAMALFEGIQQSIKKSPDYIHSKEAQDKLMDVLQLAPHHLSAKLLLIVAQNTQPKTLSATASMYYTSVSMGAMWSILAERAQLDQVQVSSGAVKQGLEDLKKLRPLADPSVRPLIDACSKLIWGWSQFQAGNVAAETVKSQAQAVDDAMAKLAVDQDLMQKMIKEGM